MSVFDQVKVQSEEQFVRSVGVSRQTFYLILGKVSETLPTVREKQPMKKRGKKFQISLADRFLLMLLYIQHYLTFAKFGLEFGISEPYAFKIYDQMVSILVKELRLKSRKHLIRSDLNVVIVDVTEQSIERLQKGQAAYYSGKKTAHDKSAANC